MRKRDRKHEQKRRGEVKEQVKVGGEERDCMREEKYKQERLGDCSTERETMCGKGKALKTAKYRRETKCGDRTHKKRKK